MLSLALEISISMGKIIKPKGWTPPNVEAEIQRQLKEGSFAEISGEAEANMKTPSK